MGQKYVSRMMSESSWVQSELTHIEIYHPISFDIYQYKIIII